VSFFMGLTLSSGSPVAFAGQDVLAWEKNSSGPAHIAATKAAAKLLKENRLSAKETYAALLPLDNGSRLLLVSLPHKAGYCGSGGCGAWLYADRGDDQWKKVLEIYIADEGADVSVVPRPGAFPDLSGSNGGGPWTASYDAAKGAYKAVYSKSRR
jgi:hypothetical protein